MRIQTAGVLLALLAGPVISLAASAQDQSAVLVNHAWIHAAPKGQFETWAFATIASHGEADSLIEVRSPDATRVVLRATTVTDAGRKVRSVIAIPVPSHGSLVLSADTYFIAFIEARRALVAGQTVTATLRFASGAIVPVSFQVSEAEGDPKDAGN